MPNLEDVIKESIIEVTNESAMHMGAMNNDLSEQNRSLSLNLIYQGAAGNANIDFEDLENDGIKLPAE